LAFHPKPDRPSHVVSSYLQSKGYRIIPVRPDGGVILGENVYQSLREIPKEIAIDIVDVFRKSAEVLPIVEEAVERGAKMVWMQEGVVNQDAAAKARERWAEGCHEPVHQEGAPEVALMQSHGMMGKWNTE